MSELWRPAPRSEEAAAVHAAAEADRRSRPERYRLDPDHLIEIADKTEGDRERFAPGWREGVEQYLASAAEDARLNATGTAMAVSTVVGRLRAGAAMSRYREEHGSTPLLPPIVITGGWRTGTTFLFRLLATDPRLRGPLPAELGAPVRVAGMTDDDRESFLDAADAAHGLLHVLNPELRAIHDSGARLPEECVLAMGTDLRSWGFTSTTRLTSYIEWLTGQDLSGTYERYRHVLEALDRGDGRRWVLKAPAHTAELPHLASTFPGAIVVHLHRDIVETIASGASLFATFRSMYSDDVDAADVGSFQADQTERWFRRAVDFRATPAADAVTFVDVDYERLIADPAEVISRIYSAADLDTPGDPQAFIDRYRAQHPRHAHGTHRYTAANFGLDEGGLRERFSFLPDFVAGADR